MKWAKCFAQSKLSKFSRYYYWMYKLPFLSHILLFWGERICVVFTHIFTLFIVLSSFFFFVISSSLMFQDFFFSNFLSVQRSSCSCSFIVVLLVAHSHCFFHQRMSQFPLHSRRIILLNIRFIVDNPFLSALGKCCATSFWPLWFLVGLMSFK